MKKHGILNVTKLSKTLETVDSKNKPLTVLVLSGSFNPVHSQHIATLECARKHLEKLGYNVVAGFLSPSSDDYVGKKLGNEALDLKVRTELCDLAAEDSDWISTCGWGWAKGGQTTKEIGQELQNIFRKYRFRALEICGADHANKFKIWRTKSIVCIGRPGYTKTVKERYELDKKTHNVPDYVKFILIEKELVDVSSTKIRKLIKEKKWETLVKSGWLSKSVIIRLYMLKNDGLPPFPGLIFPEIDTKFASSKYLDPKDRFDMAKFIEWRDKNHPRAPFSKIVESKESEESKNTGVATSNQDPKPDTLVSDRNRPRTTFSKIVEFGSESKKQLEENI